MSIDNFVPEVWSAKLLLTLQKALVYGQAAVINRDYEGDIRDKGDTVRIRNFGPVNIFNYEKDNDLPPPETLTDEETVMLIDQSPAFHFQIDDIDRAQKTPRMMDEVTKQAAYRLADVADRYIASMHNQAGVKLGTDAAPIELDRDNIYDKIVDLHVALTEQDVPKENRWIILPPWAYGLLLKDDRFVSSGGVAAESTLANACVGRAGGFMVLESNNVPNTAGAKHKILAGHNMAWSFAEQIKSMEAYRPERRFGDAMKGLHVYGAKVVRPHALACLTANKK